MVKLLVTDLIRINVLIQSIYTLDVMLVAILNRWRGPFTIDAQIDTVTYRVKKADGSTIRLFPVHVERMKKFVVFQQ